MDHNKLLSDSCDPQCIDRSLFSLLLNFWLFFTVNQTMKLKLQSLLPRNNIYIEWIIIKTMNLKLRETVNITVRKL